MEKQTSKYHGVSYQQSTKKWCASITIEGLRHRLGRFTEESDAVHAIGTICDEWYGPLCWKRYTSDIPGKRKLYYVWKAIKQRCTNPSHKRFQDYGGRGITMCVEWQYSFRRFERDMGKRPSLSHSIDRIDNNGNYEPSNCRWATREVQSRNTRIKKSNTSGTRGVTLRKDSGKWRSSIYYDGKKIDLGTHGSMESAIIARKKAEEEYWG